MAEHFVIRLGVNLSKSLLPVSVLTTREINEAGSEKPKIEDNDIVVMNNEVGFNY